MQANFRVHSENIVYSDATCVRSVIKVPHITIPKPVSADKPQRDFSRYKEFTRELWTLATASQINGATAKRVAACLDGVAGVELRRLVDLEVRRASGVFFTGSKLAEKLIKSFTFNPDDHFIYDPAVGAADLLLAVARRLPVGADLPATLKIWGSCLAGTDLQAELVEAAKLRLALLARQRLGCTSNLPQPWRSLFPLISVGDGLAQDELYARATHVVTNPPYSFSKPDNDCKWTSGRVSDASRFIILALERVKPGTHLLAVLPDVLRSGSFQLRWRTCVSDLAEVCAVKRHGIFDDFADIDVFRLHALRRVGVNATVRRWPKARKPSGGAVEDCFAVHVGRVVPHRDPETGPEHPYIHPRCVPVWKEMVTFTETRRNQGRVYDPPFVVLRRTSRPGHPYRATASVIGGKAAVAVENHLIVCAPRDGTITTCRKLMRQLRTEVVNKFLDQRIRCRHLTVAAVKAIPFSP